MADFKYQPKGHNPLFIYESDDEAVKYMASFVLCCCVVLLLLLLLLYFTYRFFRNYISLIFEFIPQMIFLVGMFGWLCVMVFIKWIMYGAGPEFSEERGSFCAPSVLITFINMVLLKKEKVSRKCKDFYISPLLLLTLSLPFSPSPCPSPLSYAFPSPSPSLNIYYERILGSCGW